MSEMDTAQELAAVREQQQKFQDGVARALGLKQDPPDPRQVAAERASAAAALAQRDEALRQQAVENAVLRSAGRYGGNGAALADSKAFMDKVAHLDPAADSFAGDLGDAIRTAVESGPRFRGDGANAARTTAPRARPDPVPNAGRAGGGQWTIEDVRASTPSQTLEALEAGLLTDLGCYPSKRRR